MAKRSLRRSRSERRELRGRQPSLPPLNLTAMIDVTFQLLIYFLLAASFALGEELYRLDLPDRDARERRSAGASLEDPVFIRLAGSDERACTIAVEIDGFTQAPADAAALESLLRASAIDAANPTGTIARTQPIVIVATPDTRWEHAVAAFDAAVRAGFTRIAFAAPAGAVEDLP